MGDVTYRPVNATQRHKSARLGIQPFVELHEQLPQLAQRV